MRPDDHRTDRVMPGSGTEFSRDEWIVAIADHGVDPTDMPGRVVGTDGRDPLARRRKGAHRKTSPKRNNDSFSFRDLLIWCVVPFVAVLLVRIFLIGFYVIPSGSMRDTIEIGDRVITSKLTPEYFDLKRGDIVVFHDPANWLNQETTRGKGDYLIKRLIGLPGDVVECGGAGQPVKINGVAIDETSYIKSGVDPSSFSFRVEVTAGHIFVMGDNRASSADSRYHQDDGDHGLVPIDNVVGVGLMRYWPLNRMSFLSSHHDVFKDVPAGKAQ